MRIYIKSENTNDGEIEFHRLDDGALFISILNGHGQTYYTMEQHEIKALIDFIQMTNERMDQNT